MSQNTLNLLIGSSNLPPPPPVPKARLHCSRAFVLPTRSSARNPQILSLAKKTDKDQARLRRIVIKKNCFLSRWRILRPEAGSSAKSPDSKSNLKTSPAYFRLLLCGWLLAGTSVALVLAWGFEFIPGLTPAIMLAGSGIVVMVSGSVWRRIHSRLKTETSYRILVESSDQAYFRADSNGTIRYLSAAWEELTEHPRSDSLGQPLSRFVYPEDLGSFARHLEPVRDRRVATVCDELRLATAGGGWRWVEFAINVFTAS